MARSTTLKPAHSIVKNYYATLRELRSQDVEHELGLRRAFENLLAESARPRGWTLVGELSTESRGRTVIPDGTIRDRFNVPRGYWEAKDTRDDLEAEIRKKIERGYPTTNIIFEDTRQAVLYQDKREVLRVDLGKPEGLCDVVNRFHGHVEPEIETFEKAVAEFKDRVPNLGRGLKEIIEAAHNDNPAFREAFGQFLELCRKALNPSLSEAAVDEMLIQHLLTERLFRTVFSDSDFTRRNVIAAQVERVIDALVSQSFSRDDYLRTLDTFYAAIEGAARNLPDFSDKQHFLNTVYEQFFQGYSVKVADTHGIVYTPQPIVDFMCASVEEVLKAEFGLSLSSPEVVILDPCTGTGNFIVNLMRRVSKRDLPRVYKEQLFANEVMLLPYYIAALNIEHAYYELTGKYEPFEGLCFVDTLDLAEAKQAGFEFMTEKNTERVQREKRAKVTVVIGNPPYNMGQQNENDNNKNRVYKAIDKRIRETYARDSSATLKTKLYDPYVRFFRWAVDRVCDNSGIICFVSNNSFVDQQAFDGVQKHFLSDFESIYHVDLHGNVRKNPKLSGTTHNVFGIQVGVGITLAVTNRKGSRHRLHYCRVGEYLRREEKLRWLSGRCNVRSIEWEHTLEDHWLRDENAELFAAFLPVASRQAKASAVGADAIFRVYSPGVSTNRDAVVYDFHKARLEKRIRQFCEHYNAEVDRYRRAGRPARLDDFLDYSTIKWSRDLKQDLVRGVSARLSTSKFRVSLYRPFTTKHHYFADVLNDSPGLLRHFFPKGKAKHNRIIVTSDLAYRSQQPNCLVSNRITDLHLCATVDGHQCFPFYTYNADGTNRRENITDWALDKFRSRYNDPSITKWDIFYYAYGVLHHPGYREKFADNLKRELPRIPLAPDFRSFSGAGQELARLHLGYEKLDPHPLEFIENPDRPLSYVVADKMRLNKTKTELKVNPSLTLRGIPEKCFEYRLGNRSALDWVISQYRVTEHKRSGIKSDPNRPDDPEYIVRLVGQVIKVSLETVRIVQNLPAQYC